MFSFTKGWKRAPTDSTLYDDLETMSERDRRDIGLERHNQRLLARKMASVQ